MAITTQITNPQRAALLAAIKANPTAAAYRSAGDGYSLLAWCNAASAALAWRVNVQPQEADEAATYTVYDSLLAGKRDSWALFLRYPRNFTRGKVRAWVTDVWGAAIAASSSESILQAGTEFATNAQNAMGGVSKTTGTVIAIDRTYSDQVTDADVSWMIAQA